ncbi:MAG: porphobilinogen synthase [Lentisphaeria bacterium]|nr:porphobilinogen synthase [Lentisphaeria bacterium]
MNTFPDVRLRRLRRTPQLRAMLNQALPGPERFMWPVFVREGEGVAEPIDSMPGQFRYSIDKVVDAIAPVWASGVKSVLVFGLPDPATKDECGNAAADSAGIVQRAVRALKSAYPELVVFTDVCLCAYTSHGHCGVIRNGNIENDPSLQHLANTAVSHALAGADGVAPSAMMDGQVAAIRDALAKEELHDTILMSYSTKFASSMYGPFRDAEQSAPQEGDRQSYQAPYADLDQALRESELDVAEGADMLMVKPALFYLDIVHQIKQRHRLPLAVYNVSGEYAMHIAMAERGWGDLNAMVRESTLAMARAGADIIISYWANQYEKIFQD